ncbi:hypothetical protein M8C21_025598, partial [Ambrosia artemisiifolia]
DQSDDSSFELLCYKVSETLVLSGDEGLYNFNGSEDNPSNEEIKYLPFDPTEEGDVGSDRETNPDLDVQPVLDRGKKRNLMTMLNGMPNHDTSCKLIRKGKSSYGFVHYFDRRSAALAILAEDEVSKIV